MLFRSKNKDIAIVPLSYRYFAGSWESAIYPYLRKRYGHLKSWGLTPQGVYKPGSDIQYKIFIRNESLDSITLPPKDLTYGITILDPTGKVFKEIKSIKLTEFGTYAGTLQTSKLFPSGEYHAYITIDDNGDINKINSFNFIVADFTPSPFKSLTNLNKKSYQKGDNLIVEGAAQMHSGGAYTGNDARIIVNLTAKRFQPSNSKYKSFDFDDANYSDQNIAISNTTEKLNQTGQREIKLKLDHEIPNGTLFVETAVRDDRGKFISSRSVAEYFGQDKFLGGKLDKWSYRVGDDVEINHVVLDSNSALFKKSKVEVEVFWESVTAAKVKSSGNAYITKYNRSWESVHKCEIIIKDEDENICEFEPKKPGYYKVMSKIANGKSQWSESFYVVGSGQFLWGGDDTDHLTLVSENESVKIKDNVKVLVKNPFPKAKALITIERYGILDQWIEDIDESAHMLEFKIKPDYLPGFYVSVNLFSHRASESKGFGKLDLGKPSMKTGYLKFEVKDDYKVIDIDINSNKKEYYPGESVELEFEAEAKNGKLADVEIAIAVIDESVFDLIRGGETYFDPYKGLFELDSLDVQTFSLIKNLIGKQKFEKKGANQGGDGGGPSKVRSFIDYLAYWNPSVELKNGEGKIQFKLPDNLTGWKVLAIATDKADRMGLSTSRFISNLPTEIRAALPNQLIEGDQFKARFTVMNREDKKRTLNIEMQVNGVVEGDENQRNQKASLILEPGERKYVEMNIDVGKVKALRSNEKGELRFLVKAGDSIHQDIFTKIISVDKKRPSSVATTYGKILENSQELIDIKFPNDIYTDIGGLEVTGTTTLLGQLEDGFRYLKDYPYQCWEQKISKAVGAAQFIKLNHYFKDKLLWKDADKLVKQTIKEAANFQLKNGAMSYYGKYESAYLSAFTLNAFAWLESYGYTIPEKIKDQLIDFNKKLLKERLFSKYWNLNMRSTTRAISLAGLSEFGVLKPEELSRFWPRFENMSKFGQFHFYQAAINLRSSLSNDSLEKLLGSLIVDAGKVRFNEVKNEKYGMLHSSNKRTQCMALLTTTNAIKKKITEKKVSDLPDKLLRSIISDMKSDADFFDSTQSSLYCLNAMINYANMFESKKPKLNMIVEFKNTSLGTLSFNDFSNEGKMIPYDLKAEDVGKTNQLKIINEGAGTVYYKTQLSYSSKADKKVLNHGIALTKLISVERNQKWIPVTEKMELKRGEIIHIDLYVSIPMSRHFVIIDDPIAGGLEPINTDLANAVNVNNAQQSLNNKNKSNYVHFGSSAYSFYHQELKHDRAVFYSTYLPIGDYHVSYNAQVVATGKFTSMPAIAKEMYYPETNGSTKNQEINIVE